MKKLVFSLVFSFMMAILFCASMVSYAQQKSDSTSTIVIETGEDEIRLTDNIRPILSYRVSECYPPDGVDTVFRRSAYLHPLWSPGGEVLTMIQPPDHYHHYGIWAPWTKTHINDREVDYWNLAKKQGTVRFSELISVERRPLFYEMVIKKEHVCQNPLVR